MLGPKRGTPIGAPNCGPPVEGPPIGGTPIVGLSPKLSKSKSLGLRPGPGTKEQRPSVLNYGTRLRNTCHAIFYLNQNIIHRQLHSWGFGCFGTSNRVFNTCHFRTHRYWIRAESSVTSSMVPVIVVCDVRRPMKASLNVRAEAMYRSL